MGQEEGRPTQLHGGGHSGQSLGGSDAWLRVPGQLFPSTSGLWTMRGWEFTAFEALSILSE